MQKRRTGLPASGQVEDEGLDHRERFVLRGGAEGIPESVPEEPEPTIDLELALRNLGSPERRPRVRRHSEL